MTPALMTTVEVRAWLRDLGIARVRLPRETAKAIVVDGVLARWLISPGPAVNCWLVEPYFDDEVAS